MISRSSDGKGEVWKGCVETKERGSRLAGGGSLQQVETTHRKLCEACVVSRERIAVKNDT